MVFNNFHDTVLACRRIGGKVKSVARKVLKALAALVILGSSVVLFNYLRYIVFWFPTETVAFESDGVEIRGTLVKPSDEGAFPAVIILHGSGPESMREPSYHIIANTIVRSGMAVLLYDKRGVGQSGGDFESSLYRDFVADAISAVAYLAGRDDIDADSIGLQGNSEGGWLAPEVAYRTGQVAFIFNRAGPPLSWVENVIWEVRNDALAVGVAEADVGMIEAITRKRWDYYIAAAKDPSLGSGPLRDAISAEMKHVRETVPGARDALPESLAPFNPEIYAADATIYDPRPFLEAIDIPMMYTFGETDINVPTARSVAYLEWFRREFDKDIDVVVFEGVGHPMANWTGMLTAGYVPEFLDLLGSWCAEQLSGKPAHD